MELERIRSARPKLGDRRAEVGAPLRQRPISIPHPRYLDREQTEVRTVDSVARNVTIHVDVFRNAEVRPVCGLTSQWVDSIDPQAVSHTGRFAEVDIPANENPARCLLILQHADTDDDCYLHSFGVLIGQYQRRSKPPPVYLGLLPLRRPSRVPNSRSGREGCLGCSYSLSGPTVLSSAREDGPRNFLRPILTRPLRAMCRHLRRQKLTRLKLLQPSIGPRRWLSHISSGERRRLRRPHTSTSTTQAASSSIVISSSEIRPGCSVRRHSRRWEALMRRDPSPAEETRTPLAPCRRIQSVVRRDGTLKPRSRLSLPGLSTCSFTWPFFRARRRRAMRRPSCRRGLENKVQGCSRCLGPADEATLRLTLGVARSAPKLHGARSIWKEGRGVPLSFRGGRGAGAAYAEQATSVHSHRPSRLRRRCSDRGG